ncbi:ras-related protein Rap-1b [Centruroides vittatus]|uniref:ras-related protein Rap-1b n=1 Tax=Centruroides vittatus TaxID=120091 RepID=UPI00350E9EB1
MGDDTEYRIRLVILGGGRVGKSSIVKRFLFNAFCEKYRPTVEDLFCREFDIGSTVLKVDIMDTAGDLQFPAMRRLSIANGLAFLLVYSIDCPTSFNVVKQCFEEIREQKKDFQELPIIVCGNKSDLGEEKRVVKKEDVAEWVFCDLPRLRVKVMECSAKENINIKEIFKAFLQLSKIPLPEGASLRRRSSAHVPTGKSSRVATSLSPHHDAGFDESSGSRIKPRSRSLIRRSSKKVSKLKEQAQDVDDCVVS